MTWSPGGKPSYTEPRKSWSPDGPTTKPLDSKVGWWRVPTFDGIELLETIDLGVLQPNTAGFEYQTTKDLGTVTPALDGLEKLVLTESGLLVPRSSGAELSQSSDKGLLGFTATELSTSLDFGTLSPSSGGSSMSQLLSSGTYDNVATFGFDGNSAGDSGTGWFTPPADAPWSTAFNSTAGTVTCTIPVWSKYIVLAGVGGGASGMTGNGSINQHGTGGAAGKWNGVILERGVHIPWTTVSITVVVGAGGASPANSDWAAAIAGAATTFTATGMTTLTCAGGSGTNGGTSGGGIREGQAAGSYTIDGSTYVGGSDQPSGNGVVGNPPGGGGAGGNGGIFGTRTRGGAGARGGAFIKAKAI